MSTRRKRRLFAAPLVLIAAPACSGAPPAEQNRATEVSGPLDPNTPPVKSVDDASDPDETRQITEPPNRSGEGDGTVTPPQPEKPAPDPEVTEQELPEAPDGAMVTRRADGTCWLIPEMPDCPPNVACNPPPPRQVQCPDDE